MSELASLNLVSATAPHGSPSDGHCRADVSPRGSTIVHLDERGHAMDGEVTDVRIMRMKNMGPEGDRGYVVETKLDGRWIKVPEYGTRSQAERIAAEARRRMQSE